MAGTAPRTAQMTSPPIDTRAILQPTQLSNPDPTQPSASKFVSPSCSISRLVELLVFSFSPLLFHRLIAPITNPGLRGPFHPPPGPSCVICSDPRPTWQPDQYIFTHFLLPFIGRHHVPHVFVSRIIHAVPLQSLHGVNVDDPKAWSFRSFADMEIEVPGFGNTMTTRIADVNPALSLNSLLHCTTRLGGVA